MLTPISTSRLPGLPSVSAPRPGVSAASGNSLATAPQDHVSLTWQAAPSPSKPAPPQPATTAARPAAGVPATLTTLQDVAPCAPGPDLQPALKAGLAHLREAASPDGIWRTPYYAGNTHELIGVLGLSYIGLKDEQNFREERGIFQKVMRDQNPDGSLPAWPKGPTSRSVTRMYLLALDAAAQNGNPELQDPDFAARLGKSRAAAEAFLETPVGRDEQDPVMASMPIGMLESLVHPERATLLKTLPFNEFGIHTLLYSRVGKMVSQYMCAAIGGVLPGAAILGERASENRHRTALGNWLHGLFHHPEKRLHECEETVLKQQDPNGGWALITEATAYNLMALKERGHKLDEPCMQKGIDYIRRHRVPQADGSIAQRWTNADLWDSSCAADALLTAGTQASDPLLRKTIDQGLREQCPDGRWAFSSGAPNFAENDSAGVMLKFLADAHATAAPDQKQAMAEAVRRGAQAMFDHQMKDGGWNAWDKNPWEIGNRVPGPIEALATDPSTPDVTGRILYTLARVHQSGLLDEAQEKQYLEARDKAVRYLQKAQAPNGSWWGRWTVGYEMTAGFILPALKEAGVDMRQPWVQEARQFLLQHQNLDGGWGESWKADVDSRQAGRGPSTPAQTGLAMAALVAASPDPTQDRALARGAEYLQAVQENGKWDNKTPLYTYGPGFEYYDAPFMSHYAATAGLLSYAQARG